MHFFLYESSDRSANTYDLAPASEHSVTVLSPTLEALNAIFSTIGLPQNDTIVEVDIRNRAVRLVTALEESTNILLVNTHSPRKFIVSRRSQDQYQY